MQDIAITLNATGGPEQLQAQAVQVGEPGPGQIRMRHHAVGVNFIDVYHRSGLYPLALPQALGMEGAGVVEAVGEGVSHLQPGDRAAYAGQPPGAYSTRRLMPAREVCRLPDAVDFDTAAASMLKGLTVQYLLKKTLPVQGLQPGDFVLWHAAAGGVGLLACQWARHLGLRLIATAGSDEKCQLALDHGAAHAINYRGGFVDAVKAITAAAASRWSTTAWARTLLREAWTAWRPLACWPASATPAGLCRPSAPACWAPRARST